jgi:hypothetical protein
LDAVKTSVASIDGKTTAVNTGAVVVSSSALPALAATSTKQSDGTQKTQVVDGSGNVIGATSNALDVNIKSGGSSGTQYTEDVAAAADPVGTALNLIRKDTLAGLTTTDGDNVAARGTDKGELYVKHVDSIPITDNSGSLTVDAPVGTPVFVRLSDGSSAIATLPVSLASVPSHAVTNAGTFVVQENGSALTSLQLIDDIVYTDDTSTHATGTSKGALIMAAATPTDTAVNANDIGAVAMTLNRELLVQVNTALPAGTNAIGKLSANSGVDIGDVDITSIAAGDNNIGNVDIVTMPNVTLAAGTNTNEVVGDVAEDIGLAGNPVRIGGRASAAEPSAMSADNDIVTPWLDRKGRQIVAQQAGTGTQTSVASSASNVTLLAANTSRKGAQLYNDSTQVCYVRMQATATSSNFSVAMQPSDYYEVPFGYSGIIDGIWASANGNMRVTEYT